MSSLASKLKIKVRVSLVVVHVVSPVSGLGEAIYVDAMILGKRVHDLTKDVKGWDNRGKVLVDLFSVRGNDVVKDEHPVYTSSYLRLKVKDVLTAEQAQDIPMPRVLKEPSHACAIVDRLVAHAVVHDKEHPRVVYLRGMVLDKDLTLLYPGDEVLCVLVVNVQRVDKAFVEAVVLLRLTDDHSGRDDVHLVVKKVLYKDRLTSTRSTYDAQLETSYVGLHGRPCRKDLFIDLKFV